MYGVYGLLYNLVTHEQAIFDADVRFDTLDEAVAWMDYDDECEFFSQSITEDTKMMGPEWFVDDVVALPVAEAELMEAEFNGDV